MYFTLFSFSLLQLCLNQVEFIREGDFVSEMLSHYNIYAVFYFSKFSLISENYHTMLDDFGVGGEILYFKHRLMEYKYRNSYTNCKPLFIVLFNRMWFKLPESSVLSKDRFPFFSFSLSSRMWLTLFCLLSYTGCKLHGISIHFMFQVLFYYVSQYSCQHYNIIAS